MHFIPRQRAKSIIWRQGVGLCLCVVLLLLVDSVAADDWPFFRGPHCNGASTESDWTSYWPDSGPEIAWRADAGIGASSVVVEGNHAVTMGSRREPDEEIVWCFDARNGDVLWHVSCSLAYASGYSATPKWRCPITRTGNTPARRW
jgi:hypothetical protein